MLPAPVSVMLTVFWCTCVIAAASRSGMSRTCVLTCTRATLDDTHLSTGVPGAAASSLPAATWRHTSVLTRATSHSRVTRAANSSHRAAVSTSIAGHTSTHSHSLVMSVDRDLPANSTSGNISPWDTPTTPPLHHELQHWTSSTVNSLRHSTMRHANNDTTAPWITTLNQLHCELVTQKMLTVGHLCTDKLKQVIAYHYTVSHSSFQSKRQSQTALFIRVCVSFFDHFTFIVQTVITF